MYTRIRGTKSAKNSKTSRRSTKPYTHISKEHRFFIALIVLPTTGYIIYSMFTLHEEIHFLRKKIKEFGEPTNATVKTENSPQKVFNAPNSALKSTEIRKNTTGYTSTEESIFQDDVNESTPDAASTSTETTEFDMFPQVSTEYDPLGINVETVTVTAKSTKGTTEKQINTVGTVPTGNSVNEIKKLRTSIENLKFKSKKLGTSIENLKLKTKKPVHKIKDSISDIVKDIVLPKSFTTIRSIESNDVVAEALLNQEKRTYFHVESADYFANSSACSIPKLNPYDPTILRYTGDPQKVDCTEMYPLLFYTDLESNLILNSSLRDNNFTNCCYKNLSRGDNSDNVFKENSEEDDEFSFSEECIPIKNVTTKIPSSHEFIAVVCHNQTSNKSQVIDLFGFPHIKPHIEERVKIDERNASINEKPNVLIIGLDAISHMNFMRTMPKTHSFITKTLSGISMNGFTKVGDNTLPNVLPALTGQSMAESNKTCFGNGSYFDDCPFIWKAFSAAGYRTVYVEDAPSIAAFNYLMKGFKKPPTDYYLRGLLQASMDTFGKHESKNDYICFGPRLAFQVLMDYLKKAAYAFKSDRRYFYFMWSNSLSHDYLNKPKLGDEMLFQTLQYLFTNSYLNNTILVMLSDHGIRWGGIRRTYQGLIEERMPFMYTMFPNWFFTKYKSAIYNFKLNSDKLTTPYDVHETLKDFLHLENLTSEKLNTRFKELLASMKKPRFNSTELGPRGISLFLPISSSRDCKQAEIPDHYCICHETEAISVENNSEIISASQSILAALNEMVSQFSQCSVLSIKSISSARKFASWRVVKEKIIEELKKSGKSDAHIINIITIPGDGSFEATTFKNLTDSKWYVSGDISRINLFGNQSTCVTDIHVKKYCYCK